MPCVKITIGPHDIGELDVPDGGWEFASTRLEDCYQAVLKAVTYLVDEKQFAPHTALYAAVGAVVRAAYGKQDVYLESSIFQQYLRRAKSLKKIIEGGSLDAAVKPDV